MRKTRVLLFLFVILGTGLFVQSENKITPPVGNEVLLQKINPLKEKADNVNIVYQQVLRASTGSRSTAAALNDACKAHTPPVFRNSNIFLCVGL